MYRAVGWGIDLINTPVIALAEFETAGIISCSVLTLSGQHVQWIGSIGLVDIGKRCSEVHIVRGGRWSRRPAQDNIPRHFCRTVSRTRISGVRRWPQTLISIPVNLIDIDSFCLTCSAYIGEYYAGQRFCRRNAEWNIAFNEVLLSR